jgi:uncharacterized repeat protein (TIGR01451 family)
VLAPRLTLTKTADSTTANGDQIGFRITLSNASSAGTASGVTLTDPLPNASGNTATWAAQTSGTTQNLLNVIFVDASNGWAVGAGGNAVAGTPDA